MNKSGSLVGRWLFFTKLSSGLSCTSTNAVVTTSALNYPQVRAYLHATMLDPTPIT